MGETLSALVVSTISVGKLSILGHSHAHTHADTHTRAHPLLAYQVREFTRRPFNTAQTHTLLHARTPTLSRSLSHSLFLPPTHERSFHPPTCSQGCTSAHGEATVILRPIVPLVWRVLSNKKALSSWSKTVRPTGAL